MGDGEELTYKGTMNKHKVTVLLDSGAAAHTVTSRKTADVCGLSVNSDTAEVELGDN